MLFYRLIGLQESDPTTGDIPVGYLGYANDADIDAGRRGTISRAKHAIQEATESLYQDACNHCRHNYLTVHDSSLEHGGVDQYRLGLVSNAQF